MSTEVYYGPDTDGIDHINVYSKSRTELGRLLSNFAFTPFHVYGWGDFASVEGFWYYITRKDERLRHLYGYQAKKLGKDLPAEVEWRESDFKSIIKEAITAKLMHNEEILDSLRASTLPLKHYYVYGDRVVDAGHSWVIKILEDIRDE